MLNQSCNDLAHLQLILFMYLEALSSEIPFCQIFAQVKTESLDFTKVHKAFVSQDLGSWPSCTLALCHECSDPFKSIRMYLQNYPLCVCVFALASTLWTTCYIEKGGDGLFNL